jgi:hypothetical protein
MKVNREGELERMPNRGVSDAEPPEFRLSLTHWVRLEDMDDIRLRGKISISFDDLGLTVYNLSLVYRDRPVVNFPRRPIKTEEGSGLGRMGAFHNPKIRRAFSEACLDALLIEQPELNKLIKGNAQ